MSKLSYEDWVRVHKQDEISKDRMNTLKLWGVSAGGFVVNPILGIVTGVGTLALRCKMDAERIEAWKVQYEEYLKE
ncbi:MAG: hypothetical protein QNJ42_23345 [Crocosphaera sp.]|nr:hypothetical protein [Crocosphaera sp.]